MFAAKGFLGRQVDKYRRVGQIFLQRIGVDAPHKRFVQPARARLIGERRIDVAVADHQLALAKRGLHAVVQMLNPRRRVQKSLAFVRHLRIFTVEQNSADGLGNFSASRLARKDVGHFMLCEILA